MVSLKLISAFVAIYALFAVCSCIQRLVCKIEGHFDIVINNYKSNLAPIASFKTKTKRGCLLECLSVQHGTSINFNSQTGDCEVLRENSTTAIGSLEKQTGWVFISSTGLPGNKCRMLDPCKNDGKCSDSCDSHGYNCTCDEYHHGVNCEKDLQDRLDELCVTLTSGNKDTHARFGGKKDAPHAYEWRCFVKSALTGDLLYYANQFASYYTRSALGDLFKQYHKTSEYVVGEIGNSCEEECSKTGKKCNHRMRTVNSIYVFHLAGVSCRYPVDRDGQQTGYYVHADEPAYIPSDKYCYGFARLPKEINCKAKSPAKRRLCRCT